MHVCGNLCIFPLYVPVLVHVHIFVRLSVEVYYNFYFLLLPAAATAVDNILYVLERFHLSMNEFKAESLEFYSAFSVLRSMYECMNVPNNIQNKLLIIIFIRTLHDKKNADSY